MRLQGCGKIEFLCCTQSKHLCDSRKGLREEWGPTQCNMHTDLYPGSLLFWNRTSINIKKYYFYAADLSSNYSLCHRCWVSVRGFNQTPGWRVLLPSHIPRFPLSCCSALACAGLDLDLLVLFCCCSVLFDFCCCCFIESRTVCSRLSFSLQGARAGHKTLSLQY